MNKRKIVLLAVALCMVAILGFGGTLAYLTDEETATNVFTVGNVDIKLNEEFKQDSLLMPSTGKDADGNVINAVEKKISITNMGTEDAYVRLHFAIPTVLDSGDPDFLAYANSLHFNFGVKSMQEGEWNWYDEQDKRNEADTDKDVGYPGNGGDWYFYTKNIDGVDYNVYVATWMSPLAGKEAGATEGATTDVAIRQVYLDSKLDNEDITKILEACKGEIKILVAAEAVQVAGFEGQPYKAFADAYNMTGTDGNKNLPGTGIFDMTIDYTGKVEYDNEATK